MSKLVAFVSTSIALFLLIGMISYFRYFAPAGTFLHRDLDAAAVVREVQQLNELVTVRYVIQQVVGVTEEKHPLGSESILLMVGGRVLAGVDLASVTQYDVGSVHAHEVALHLPPPRILEAFIDEKNTKVWDRQITWWTPWVSPDLNLEHEARLQAIDQIRKAAVDQGILKDAQRNAQDTIVKFLRNFGITRVTFSPSAVS
jgi:hypothetical protein